MTLSPGRPASAGYDREIVQYIPQLLGRKHNRLPVYFIGHDSELFSFLKILF